MKERRKKYLSSRTEFEFWFYQIILWTVGLFLWRQDWAIMWKYTKYLVGAL